MQNAARSGDFLEYVYILVGLVGLFVGGEALVRGSVNIARRLSISPLVIGLTVVAFGTSAPELLVSLQAAWRGAPDIAVGNIVGSNIANVLLILGMTALVWPIRVSGAAVRNDAAFMLVGTVFLVPLFALGEIGRWAGAVLFVALVFYLVWTFLTSRDADDADEPEHEVAPKSPLVSLLWVGGGLLGLLFGAKFLVEGSVSVARDFGVSEAFIGLTIVAMGTSLPELATSLIAAFRRHSEIAIGNILGSNIFNIFGILGLTAMISPISVAPRFLTFDLPIMIAVSFVLVGLLLTRPQIGRAVGGLMLLGYVGYVIAA